MPYPFVLPTTGSVILSDFFESVTHPSLPLAAATQRSVVRDALKQYKRLSPQAQPGRLPSIQDALTTYLSYLFALDAGMGYNPVGPTRPDVRARAPLVVEWRSTLSPTPPGRSEPPRTRLTGLHPELAFALTTLAHTHTLLARAALRPLPSLSGERRTSAIQTAIRHLFAAHAIHSHTLSLPCTTPGPDLPPDLHPSTLSALASLALAEATLAAAAKDDAYAAAVADDRNASNSDWMYRGPRIEKSRAGLLVRVCMKAAEYAAEAHGGLVGGGGGATVGAGMASAKRRRLAVADGLGRYAADLAQTSRARAARFSAIHAEMEGRIGEGIAWLRGAKRELGLTGEGGEEGGGKGGLVGGLRGLKQNWMEKREERKVERGGEWGLDAGRLEEAKIVEALEAKWEKENRIMNVQAVPESGPLLAALPSGRTLLAPPKFEPPELGPERLASMRAPPDPDEVVFRGNEEDSGGEEGYGGVVGKVSQGREEEEFRSATSSSYY